MTWRPNKYLLEGELDNTSAGQVTGWLRFAGLPEKVVVALNGDFRTDIRGTKVVLKGRYNGTEAEAVREMKGFALRQTGQAGNMTAGFPPQEWTDYPYFEWYSDSNERVVLDPEPHQIDVVVPSAPVGAGAGATPNSS
jgi:hypothetical protein